MRTDELVFGNKGYSLATLVQTEAEPQGIYPLFMPSLGKNEKASQFHFVPRSA
jgi:hypothetical protein